MQFFAGRWREDHDTHRLSRRMAAIMRQNLTFAIGVMAVLVIGGLFFELPLPLIISAKRSSLQLRGKRNADKPGILASRNSRSRMHTDRRVVDQLGPMRI